MAMLAEAPGALGARLLDAEVARLQASKEALARSQQALAVPAEQLLKIDAGQLKVAKDAELLKAIRVRFIEDGPDRTIDQFTQFPRETKVEGMSAQQTVLELRQAIAEQERMALEDVNLFGQNTALNDKLRIADLYVDWMGFGLEDWPPRVISKPRVRGFEVYVDVPACRDTSVWDAGRMQSYFDRKLVFAVAAGTTVAELKAMLMAKLGIPAKRHKLTVHLRESLRDAGRFVLLDDDKKTMADYKLEQHCVTIKFEKCAFDENGEFIFDDAYWDDQGYHPPPSDSWIPLDSLCDRSRPDAQKADPVQPLSIASDRRNAAQH